MKPDVRAKTSPSFSQYVAQLPAGTTSQAVTLCPMARSRRTFVGHFWE